MIRLIQDANGYALAVLPNDSHMSTWAEAHKSLVTDQTVPLRILPLFKEGDTVVDVGANIGTHTVPYAKHVGPNGLVLAFEPYVPSFVALAVNCRDLPQVRLHNCALGNCNRTVGLVLPSDTNMGTVAVNRDATGETLMRKLDDFALASCAFIKIDAEGYEPEVIAGAINTLARCKPTLFVELNDGALARYGYRKDSVLQSLISIGYEMELADPRYTLKETQLDVIMRPKG